jgi:threonine synthase
MKYISTRGESPALKFQDIVVSGLAPDGGLYMPETIPSFTLDEIQSWKELPYHELAYKIISPFVEDEIPADILQNILKESYSDFRDPKVAPLKKIVDGEYLLELFHGPTLAFKDFALQFLGRVLDYILEKREQDVIIIGATSGDTGSAAIEGCKHSKHVRIFMLHPHGRTSATQRLQMTTVLADNVFNLAIESNFDDCQAMVKSMFREPGFANGTPLVAVNSINWARIMAQIVYYFSAYLQMSPTPSAISFSVPTGNFGDIFAGYIAKKMGLPVEELIVATNSNDILHRFFSKNDYSSGEVTQTLSPSMDIQVSSNFERLLFEAHKRDSATVKTLMEGFHETKKLSVSDDIFKTVQANFSSYSANDETTCEMIKTIYDTSGEVLDPHTATGFIASRAVQKNKDIPMVILATAHPAKFADAIQKAGVENPPLPEPLAKLEGKEERFTVLPSELHDVKGFIQEHL